MFKATIKVITNEGQELRLAFFSNSAKKVLSRVEKWIRSQSLDCLYCCKLLGVNFSKSNKKVASLSLTTNSISIYGEMKSLHDAFNLVNWANKGYHCL